MKTTAISLVLIWELRVFLQRDFLTCCLEHKRKDLDESCVALELEKSKACELCICTHGNS